MTSLFAVVDGVKQAQSESGKPMGVVLAGHNGSGKSTLWYKRLADDFRIPLVNADRMMMSILPEGHEGALPAWAAELRDNDASWMEVAQRGVQAFVAQAMLRGVPFAMETVFSDWRAQPDGTIASKIDLIREMQKAGYFVVLFFVGLSSAQVSIARVATRVQAGGHAVDEKKLIERFPRTQKAVAAALDVADAAILLDNSRTQRHAFTACHVRLEKTTTYDLRRNKAAPPAEISAWLDKVVPTQ
ncbi:MAG: toxin [Alphaproteobacteria bacterium]|nr:toxin [Alphaproteobacteria bacterium]